MKKYILATTLVAGISLAVAAAENAQKSSLDPSPSASPDGGGPRCTKNSASVEVHTFYGTKEILTEKITNLPGDLSERRVFLQLTQSGRKQGAMTTSEVRLFERQPDGSIAITVWKKAEAPQLFDQLDSAIIKNKGEYCVGEAMKAVLTKKLKAGKPVAPLPASGSFDDAFSPSIQETSGDFAKTVIIFGC